MNNPNDIARKLRESGPVVLDDSSWASRVPLVSSWSTTVTIQVQFAISGALAIALYTQDESAARMETMICERASEHIRKNKDVLSFSRRANMRKHLALPGTSPELHPLTFHATPTNSPTIAPVYKVIEPCAGTTYNALDFDDDNPLILCAFVVFDLVVSSPTLTLELQ